MPVFWFEPDVPAAEVAVGRMPVWIMDTEPDGVFYGFPYDPAAAEGLAPSLGRRGRPEHVERAGTGRCRPGPGVPAAEHAGSRRAAPRRGVCLYTNTPDEIS